MWGRVPKHIGRAYTRGKMLIPLQPLPFTRHHNHLSRTPSHLISGCSGPYEGSQAAKQQGPQVASHGLYGAQDAQHTRRPHSLVHRGIQAPSRQSSLLSKRAPNREGLPSAPPSQQKHPSTPPTPQFSLHELLTPQFSLYELLTCPNTLIVWMCIMSVVPAQDDAPLRRGVRGGHLCSPGGVAEAATKSVGRGADGCPALCGPVDDNQARGRQLGAACVLDGRGQVFS